MFSDRITRGMLPHWYRPGHAHFITYRLADSIPVDKLRLWRQERQAALDLGPKTHEFRERMHKRFFVEYDRYLDVSSERKWLADPRIADIVRENLYHHASRKYQLLAWCIMSNHVHVVLQPLELGRSDADAGSIGHVSDEVRDSCSPLSSIMHSLKSYTANRANELLGRRGRFWQPESYDDGIRDLDELQRIVTYVIGNPVHAGLCAAAVDWLRDDWHGTLAPR
jgi:REP element-mobilizing transposase RayT